MLMLKTIHTDNNTHKSYLGRCINESFLRTRSGGKKTTCLCPKSPPKALHCIGGRGCGGDLTSQVFHGTGSCGIQAATMVPLWLTCHFERSAASNIQDGRWCGFKGKGFQRSQPVNKLSSRQKNGPYSSLLCSLPCIPRPLPFLWTSFQGKQTFNIFLESIFYEI